MLPDLSIAYVGYQILCGKYYCVPCISLINFPAISYVVTIKCLISSFSLRSDWLHLVWHIRPFIWYKCVSLFQLELVLI
jgi:hypothetical protein